VIKGIKRGGEKEKMDIKRGTVILGSILVIAMMIQGVNAQNLASIEGYIFNETGAPLEGVNVTWRDNVTGELYMSMITGSNGYYCMLDQFDGTRESLITATKLGYLPNSTVISMTGTPFIPTKYYANFTLRKAGFDTGTDNCSYPSIAGIHTGTFIPFHDIYVHRIYTYPCVGTAGHSEYVAFYYNINGTKVKDASWEGYQENYNYIEFDEPFILQEGVKYEYEIRTGSYSQIIHNQSLRTTDGIINCTQFTDVNGNVYDNWIPAIKLE